MNWGAGWDSTAQFMYCSFYRIGQSGNSKTMKVPFHLYF